MDNRGLVSQTLVALFLVFGCAVSSADPLTDLVLVVTSDYEVSGRVSTVEVTPPWAVDMNLESVHSDAVARTFNGLVYVVNRLFQDNIQVLDPEQGFATIRQFSVGPGSNPQDIAFVSAERAYVSRYESVWLYEVDPTVGAVTDSVDLSAFADGDGLPEMAGLAVCDGLLFVAVQRLDRDYYWTPVPPSYLAVVDTETNSLVDVDPDEPGIQGIELTATNPSTEVLRDPETGLLYVGEAGTWGVFDGGIEAVDPVSLLALGFVASEVGLEGDINDFTLPLEGRAHAVVSVSSPQWESFCISFDWETGAKIADVWRPGGFSVTDIETHEGAGELFLCDRTYTNPGVRIFDVGDDHQLTEGPLDVGLPPQDLLVLGDEVTQVAGETENASSISVEVWPNPAAAGAAVSFSLPSPGPVEAAVYDVAGRALRKFSGTSRGDGTGAFFWDGTDALGRRAASGVYFVRVTAAGSSGSARLLLLR